MHDHHHGKARLAFLTELFSTHSHGVPDRVDTALEASERGIRAIKVSLVALLVTAGLQGLVVAFSGSVALFGDTLHNLADALTAIPLWLAFTIGRRPPNRKYTHGYGRAEDVAGIVIGAAIAASSAAAAYASVQRLVTPHPVHHLWAVALAALIGCAGNEAVAVYRIRVGRSIGSAALVADGLHARTDGLTSLAVLLSAGGVALGWQWADPAVGLGITVAILFVLVAAAREVYRRLMDAVDPGLVDMVEQSLGRVPGVKGVGEVRLRWIGHELRASVNVMVSPDSTVVEGHDIAERARHALMHDVPRLSSAMIHADPVDEAGRDHHAETAHHVPR